MERDNRDEDMMLKGTKQEMPGFYFLYRYFMGSDPNVVNLSPEC